MANKNLSYFMREETKKEQIFTAPGPDTIRDEDGNVVNLEIRKLNNEQIMKINKMYESKTLLKDKKGNYVVQNGQAVYKYDKDKEKTMRLLMVEALAYPDLKDPKLMEFYKEVDITNMPLRVFPTNKEFMHVLNEVLKVLDLKEEDPSAEVEEAKN